MDISNLSGAFSAQSSANLQRETQKTDTFKQALDKATDDAELKKACFEFESYFLNVMLREMRKTVNVGATATTKSQTEQLFQEMLDQEVAASAARSGGVGLADMMYRQMRRNIKTLAEE